MGHSAHSYYCPSSGILFDLRQHTKRKYKYSIRKVKHQREHIIRRKTASALSRKNKTLFWREVKKVKCSSSIRNTQSPLVDGLSADSDVSENLRSKLADLLNNSEDANACQDLLDDFRVNLSLSHHVITDVFITEEVVEESLLKLGRDKSDGTSLSSNYLILASPVIASFLSHLFTLILRHGYMPKALRDCLLIPIPKPNKDPSLSDSYRPIALAPNLSKVLESCILIQYQSCLILPLICNLVSSEASQQLCALQFSRMLSLSIFIKDPLFIVVF